MPGPYRVFLDEQLLGESDLESADPPMGVVGGIVRPAQGCDLYRTMLDRCQVSGVSPNQHEPEFQFLDTPCISGLRVVRTDGLEIEGCAGCAFMGFADEGYSVTILGVPYPFYAEEFPHHRDAYDRQFS